MLAFPHLAACVLTARGIPVHLSSAMKSLAGAPRLLLAGALLLCACGHESADGEGDALDAADAGGEVLAPDAARPAADARAPDLAGPPADAAEDAPAPLDGGAADAAIDAAAPDSGAPDRSPPCYPACINDLTSKCVPMGTCLAGQNSTGVNNFCYSNGVKILNSLMGNKYSTRQTLSDGTTTCFLQEVQFTMTGSTITWMNAAGALVATEVIDNAHPTLRTITCGGQTVTVETDSTKNPACASGSYVTCTEGTCM
jgi:hypothetical protein